MVTIARRFAAGLRSFASRLFGRREAGQIPGKRSAGKGRDAISSAAQDAAQEAKDALVESKRKHNGMAMQTLRSSLKSGKITEAEYAARVAQLSETGSV